jgi:hypothetical protein
MNTKRREALTDLIEKLNEVKDELELLLGEEQEYKDAMPENMQSGDKGSIADEAISNTEQDISDIDTAVDSIENAKES